jgi:hypothetical protein
MTNFDLLKAVQPDTGWFAITGIKNGRVKQTLVETREEADDAVANYLGQEYDVYFGVAKYASDKNRTKDNVQALKAFWLDIDCGEAKAAPNPKTGIPGGYLDQAEGLAALWEFCRMVGLPKPVIVNSGRGLHVYWALTEEITREDWEPVASRLHQLCVKHEFYVDAAIFEVARILRVPGTLNFKDSPPTSVEIVATAKPVAFDTFKDILGVKESVKQAFDLPTRRELSALGKAMKEGSSSNFTRIMRRSMQGDGCQQLKDCFDNQDTLAEPRWFNALSIAKHCSDSDTAIHKMSNRHPDYDPETTEHKIQHIKDPHTCATFERNNPTGCEGCPFKGKIKSPIVLGREVIAATEEENVVSVESDIDGGKDITYIIPPYPHPYVRGKGGGVWRMAMEEEAEDTLVYEYDIYVVKRMEDPSAGGLTLLRYHSPKDGVKSFTLPHVSLFDPTELRKALSSKSVFCTGKKFLFLADYLQASTKHLNHIERAEEMRLQFGWADNDRKFIVGDREYGVDGVFHSPPSTVTANIAAHMVPKGSLEKWKEVFALYGEPGMEHLAFAALTAFGTPLFKFTGQSGCILNLHSPESGTGKTTTLHMINSVWGDPKKLCAIKDDTLNAKIMRMGIHNNLPVCFDEMTNTDAKEVSVLSYCVSQGKGKDRVMQHSNALRYNASTWQTMAICSSNSSLYEKLGFKDMADGEMMRIIEYQIEKTSAIDPVLAKRMFDHQLLENFGHAGGIYAEYMVNNIEEISAALLSTQAIIDSDLDLTQRERFWSAAYAANFTGGRIAKQLGLIDWDLERIYEWVRTQLTPSLRTDVTPPSTNLANVIGSYINRHMQNVLVVNDEVDKRSNMPVLPVMEPHGALSIRYEPDTRRLFIEQKPFKNDCVKYQINYKDTLKRLGAQGIYLGGKNKRLSKGMKITSPSVHCLEFDCAVADFLDIASVVGLENEPSDGSGED